MIIILPILYLAIGIWVAILYRWYAKKPVEAHDWVIIILFWVLIGFLCILASPFVLWEWLEKKKL